MTTRNILILFVFISLLPGASCTKQPEKSTGLDPKIGSKTDILPGKKVEIKDSTLSAIWANDGLDKVAQEELRLSTGSPIENVVWNGTSVSLSAAKNEVVSVNFILESMKQASSNVSVTLTTLQSSTGDILRNPKRSKEELFDWRDREIELFYVRYLKIKGLSTISYGTYDERHVPERLRRPYKSEGLASGTWSDRPDHDKSYPDIAVPIELVGRFQIDANRSQSIWADIYVPKSAKAGLYEGSFSVSQNGKQVATVPIKLLVHDFSLSDTPASKTMLFLGYDDIAKRYFNSNAATPKAIEAIRDRHFQLAHRHKISLIDSSTTASKVDQPNTNWESRLKGDLFTAKAGYYGIGEGVGNGIFSIGTYGSWHWQNDGTEAMHLHSNAWVNWFDSHAPNTDYFLYLIDESKEFSKIENWAKSILSNSGPGKRLKSFATLPLDTAMSEVPSLSISASLDPIGDTTRWETAFKKAKSSSPIKLVYAYNGRRPSTGSFSTEDDGVALRELAWAQYKMKIDRWFFWESTYYTNFQGGTGETDVFEQAQTFGAKPTKDVLLGQTGWNYGNGDGVLFYPGTDRVYKRSSYEMAGPIASLRLKYWRRGIQDIDYIEIAKKKDAASTAALIKKMVPKAMWEYGVDDPKDPTWVKTDISWSNRADDWEKARTTLTQIIEGKSVSIASLQISSPPAAPWWHQFKPRRMYRKLRAWF